MAILGPMVVVAEKPAADLVGILGVAGAFPIVETKFGEAAAAVTEIQPTALLIAEPEASPAARHLDALRKTIDKGVGPFMPVLARASGADMVDIPFALPIALGESSNRLIACLNSALRVRNQHAAVIRRSRSL